MESHRAWRLLNPPGSHWPNGFRVEIMGKSSNPEIMGKKWWGKIGVVIIYIS